jgi:TPP-dependent pyruvate/acetoin dehydrogenase alpha subunit
VLSEDLDEEIWDAEAARVREAIDYAVGSPEPQLIDAYTDIYVEEEQ